MPTLYTTTRAPNPRRVHLFLAAKGIDPAQIGLEIVQVDMAGAQNRQPEYLAIHPLGQLPALQLDDGAVIGDSIAMCRYLDQLSPTGPALFGTTPLQQVWVDQFSRQAELEVLFPLMLAFQHGHPFWAGKVEQVAEFAPVSRRRALSRFGYFDQCLSTADYLVDNTLTVADLTLYAALDFGRLAGLKVDEQHPNLLAFYQRMHAQFAGV
jgi:glutathione S-transferase